MTKTITAIGLTLAAITVTTAAMAGDPLRDVITNTMLEMGPDKPPTIAKDAPPKVSHVMVCNADLSKCHSVELKPAPKATPKPKLAAAKP